MNIADFGEKGEIDHSSPVLLVVECNLIELLIIVAADRKGTILLSNETYRLKQFLLGETTDAVREVELYNQSPSHGKSVWYRCACFQGVTLEGVGGGVPQVQRLAYILLVGILLHNLSLDAYRKKNHLVQQSVVGAVEWEGNQFVKFLRRVNQCMLDHLCIA